MCIILKFNFLKNEAGTSLIISASFNILAIELQIENILILSFSQYLPSLPRCDNTNNIAKCYLCSAPIQHYIYAFNIILKMRFNFVNNGTDK